MQSWAESDINLLNPVQSLNRGFCQHMLQGLSFIILALLRYGHSFVWYNVLQACLFYWSIFGKARHSSSIWTQIPPPLSCLTPNLTHSSMLTPRGLKPFEFTYYFSFPSLLKLFFGKFLNSRQFYIFTSLLTIWWEKWKIGVIRSSAMKLWRSQVKHLPLLSFNTEAKLSGNTKVTCWTAAVAMTHPVLTRHEGSKRQPSPASSSFLPTATTGSKRNSEALLLPLVTHLGGQNDDCKIPCLSRGKL